MMERGRWIFVGLVAWMFVALIQSPAAAFTLNVKDPQGTAVAGFRWLLEEDNTHDPQPGVHRVPDPVDPENNTLSLSLHKSHAPVVSKGVSPVAEGGTTAVTLPNSDPVRDGRYFVSVLPFGNWGPGGTRYDMGGTTVEIVAGNLFKVGGKKPEVPGEATVYVQPNPIQTAQIAVKVFHDIRPLNNSPDVGEPGLEGFTVTLMDQGGDIIQDAFGNKLGTTYQEGADCGNPPGEFCLDGDGNPIIKTVGSGDVVTDANGEAIVKNLKPNKYGIQVEPNAPGWHQTTTIEGTKTIDAWVRPNEPPFLVEFGPPIWHAFFGFVQDMDRLNDPALFPPGPRSTVTGQVRKGHLSRPPAIATYDGPPPSTSPCLIGLNTPGAGTGEAVYVAQCADEGFFTIPNVAPGTYQLVIWDKFLLQIIFFNTVTVPDTGNPVDLGTIAVPMWFAEQEHWAYFDADKDGMRDPGEEGIPGQNVNLRFRDGTIYQAFPTDLEGYVPFEEVFPFFKWQVTEVDFARLEATGVKVVVDNGGPVTLDEFGEGKRNPVIHPGGDPFFHETGPVLTMAYQNFAGQNLRFEWGKANYDMDLNVPPYDDFPGPGDVDQDADGEYDNNGGISGIVFYATTRAEDDPALAAGEPWEPGIPRVQVNLYRDVICNSNGGPAVYPDCPEAPPGGLVGDGIPDPKNPMATFPYTPVLADVDNYPFGWNGNPGLKGPEDVDRNGNGVFNIGDAIRVTTTDSWDDNLPMDCVANPADANMDGIDDSSVVVHGTEVPISLCNEGLRTWNQARPGVFDGGYAFGPGDELLVPGAYIVEAAAPPGYEHAKEEDRNVDFGNQAIPVVLPAQCAGDQRPVPPYFSFLTVNGDGQAPLLPGVDPMDPDNAAPFAGDVRPLCDRKKVVLSTGQNAAADFFLFTDVPKAARVVGLITDDLANEAAPGKPNFTEKFAPGWMSLAFFDYTGKEIHRTYSDEFGAYNALLPSTYDIDLPTPSGVGPKMLQVCLNHPGPIPNPDFGLPDEPEFIDDPRFESQYSTTCYKFNFEPGRTTYLDTPVIRLAAFVGPLQSTLDCELPNGTPIIEQVLGNTVNSGPLITGDLAEFTIRSVGIIDVRNPDFPGDSNGDGIPDDPPTEPEFIQRNYGFGSFVPGASKVSVGDYVFPDSAIMGWTGRAIRIQVPTGAEAAGLGTGQLMVTRANGRSTVMGITLTVGNPPGGAAVWRVGPTQTITSIQQAMDMASDGDLILVDPGLYHELVIMYRRVKLQGNGYGTVIDAKHFPSDGANPLEAWRTKIGQLLGLGLIGTLPGQRRLDPLFADGEGPGIFVSPAGPIFRTGERARIDGFHIRGADLGGAIYVNARGHRLQISNNRLVNNAGNLGGGIRVGNPAFTVFPLTGNSTGPSPNNLIRIWHNHILSNGSLSNGGGIAIFEGANDYRVNNNFVCGNFSRDGGGGLSHRGLCEGGLIEDNVFAFNEVFQGAEIGGGGGGIEIAGELDPAGGLTKGSGSVLINRNLFQGNLSGFSDGGGIALNYVNGQDVEASPTTPSQWYAVQVYNNMLHHNVSGLAGAGISLQDAARVSIDYNTIADNDSTATGALAFEGGQAEPSTPQVAGIVARPHSAALAAVSGQAFSRPRSLRRNIIWHNRSFLWCSEPNQAGRIECVEQGLNPNPLGDHWDVTNDLDPRQCILSDVTGFHPSNRDDDPLFVAPYLNDLKTTAAADEGGNFVQVLYTPLGIAGDYHIQAGSPARNAASSAGVSGKLRRDFDIERRPSLDNPARTDIGADEVQP